MPLDPTSVTFQLGSGPYQKTLAQSLMAAGMLRRMFSMGVHLEVREPHQGVLEIVKRFPLNDFTRRLVWAVWRRVPHRIQPRPPVEFSAWTIDQRLANWIDSTAVFHGYTGMCLASLRIARKKGAVTLVEHAARHPCHWIESSAEERRKLGVNVEARSNFSPALMRRMEKEFQLCDRIVVPSQVASASFAQLGYGEKTLVVPTGVDADLFSPRQGEPPSLFRACYVGRVEPDKGVSRLLLAWKRLSLPGEELRLVGNVSPEIGAILQANQDSSVQTVGYLMPPQLAQCYRECSLFVFPSGNEGLAQVLLEAMASGLAVVATDMSGARECVTSGKEGIIVPAGDVDALTDAILWCYQHPDEIQAMGQAARARIERQFTLEHYNQRIIATYRALAGAARSE